MRDLFVTAIVLGGIPVILWRPWIGIIIWCWISYMNPHKLAWGFAYSMPFAMIVAIATFAGLLISRERKSFPWTRETIVMILLLFWEFVTTCFAFYPELAWPQFERAAKILLMTLVTLFLINTRARLNVMIWTIALSIAFYGVKGGIFTLATGGVHHVYGPTASFIAGNNEVALALIMVIPLLRYLQLSGSSRLVWLGLGAAMVLSAAAAIGSQSRGALLALVAMGFFFWLKSRGKLMSGVLMVVAGLVIVSVMPDGWYVRMATIENYDQDGSALGRINAWWVAWNVANVHPLTGGGFQMFQAPVFEAFAPNPDAVHDVHSIYFEMLGEQGFVGLTLFLLLGFFSWRTATTVTKMVKGRDDLRSFSDLARLLQASLIGYATGGAFLGLAYFDLYYHLVAATVITKILVTGALQEKGGQEPVASSQPWLPQAAAVPVQNSSRATTGRS